ncbi:hypothetical protein A4X13_0g7222 [Tilletia indica]|uniref:Uncharacterized protein n=1 Tax=Tilletia indica TaxID=43049 RepID=A0A8T8SM07_9BASI|nr:hypothetical protein A4X13_0g7222 [Tilletia indica]
MIICSVPESYAVEAIIARRQARMAALRARYEQEQALLALQAGVDGMCLANSSGPGHPDSPHQRRPEERNVVHDAPKVSPALPTAS